MLKDILSWEKLKRREKVEDNIVCHFCLGLVWTVWFIGWT